MTEQATATAQQQLQLRLLRARKAVEDVASEALKSSQIDETVIGGAFSSNNSKHAPNILVTTKPTAMRLPTTTKTSTKPTRRNGPRRPRPFSWA